MDITIDTDNIDHIEHCIEQNHVAIYFKHEKGKIPCCIYVPTDYCISFGTDEQEGKLQITL